MRRAVFLDRDGVLVEDTHLLTRAEELRVLPGVAEGLRRLGSAGFALVVVTNQAVVARGLVTERDIDGIHRHLEQLLREAGAPGIDGWFVCPHHPDATLEAYRVACDCRKPAPGLLLRAARELALDLERSFLVGDRPTDIAAGRRAGCRTVLVQTGMHDRPPIRTVEPLDPAIRPDHVCADLPAAADWILEVAEHAEAA